jgi:hypothetical protein
VTSAVERYRVGFHAWHAFAGGAVGEVLGILGSVDDPVPSVRVQRWDGWPDRLAETLGPDHPDTLGTRHNLASSYWSAGRTQDAINLQERVLADRERILGPDHPNTLTTRNNLAQMREESDSN